MPKPAAPSIRVEYKPLAGGVYINVSAPATSAAPVESIRIDRWDGTTELYSELTTLTGSDRFHFDDSLTGGQTYAYRALAINSEGSTFSSPSAKVAIIDPPEPSKDVTAEKASVAAPVGINFTPVESARAPRNGAYIYRSDNGSPFGQINKLTTTTGFYSDANAPADSALRYRVWDYNNVAGASRFMSPLSGWVYTQPAAPTGLTAGWDSEGNLVAEWTNPSRIAARFEVERSSDEVEWYPIPAPSTGTKVVYANAEREVGHYVRVRALSPQPTLGPVLASEWTVSALVAPNTAPESPRVVGPDYADPSVPVVVEVEGGQALRESRWRLIGGSWSAPTAGLSLSIPSGTVGPIETSVRSRATISDAWSIWSAPRQVLLRRVPTPVLTSPSGAAVHGSPVTVAWEGRPVPYVVTVSKGTLTARYVGVGTSVDVSLSTTVTKGDGWVTLDGLVDVTHMGDGVWTVEGADVTHDGDGYWTLTGGFQAGDYTITLSTFDGYLWSQPVSVLVTATELPPAAPVLAIAQVRDWEAEVTVTHPSPESVRLDLFADDHDGVWRLVASDVTSGEPVTHLYRFGGQRYRADAVTPTFGRAESAVETVDVEANQVVISGDGIHAVLRGKLNLDVADRPERAVEDLGGRMVEFKGDGRYYAVTVTGQVVHDSGSSPDVWRRVNGAETLHFRDPLGHSWPCSIVGGLPFSTSWRESHQRSFTAERLGWADEV